MESVRFKSARGILLLENTHSVTDITENKASLLFWLNEIEDVIIFGRQKGTGCGRNKDICRNKCESG